MSQRTSLTFWCFILGFVPLHSLSAHLRPIFGRVQAKIIWFLNLKTSGEHLLLGAMIQVIEWKQAVFHVPNSSNEGSRCSHDRCWKLPPDYPMLLPPNRHPAKAQIFGPATPPPWLGMFGQALWNAQDFQTRKLSCRVSTCLPLWKELQNC